VRNNQADQQPQQQPQPQPQQQPQPQPPQQPHEPIGEEDAGFVWQPEPINPNQSQILREVITLYVQPISLADGITKLKEFFYPLVLSLYPQYQFRPRPQPEPDLQPQPAVN